VHLPPPVRIGLDRALGRHGHRLERVQAHSMVHQTPFLFFLHDIGYEMNLFYLLTTAEMDHKRRSKGRRLGQQLEVVRSFSGKAPALRSSPTSSSWPPLASRPVQWLKSATNSSNLVADRVRRVLSFAGKNPSYGVCYLLWFLDRIVDGKNPNTFLV
jgi:hypothetical protein